jgi:polysaccharide chain length determinant protein (PEP-CTERM system associated)
LNPQELISEVLEQVQGSWRYRWWAVGATWLVCMLGWVYVYTIPDVYEASARVYVDTNSLLKPLMQGLTAQQNTMNEVQLVSTAVLTRPNLEKVARTTDLDLRTNSPAEFEELITALQQLIRVSGGGTDNIFTIRYEDYSREKARDVVAAVLDTFVEDAIGGQTDDAEITERALAGEIQDHEERLSAAEDSLAQFKKDNLGFMPGESGDYYERLQTALAAVSTGQTRIRQLQERRDELSRQLDGEEPVFGIMPSASVGTAACSERGRINDLQAQLAKMLVDFTEKHPRVVALNDQIAMLEERCATTGPNTPVFETSEDGDSLKVNPVYQNLRVQLSATDVELVEVRGQLKTHESAVAGLRRDVDKIAEVETQLKQLNRDYTVVQTRHQELLRRWEDLQAKKRLDPVTDNVQFRRIEPPFALADPVAPNRPLFLVAVLVFALGLGGAIAFGMNRLYPVYFSRRSIRKIAGLPVLGAISMLLEPAVVRRRRNAALAWAGTYVVLFMATIVVIAFGSRAPELVRGLVERMVA